MHSKEVLKRQQKLIEAIKKFASSKQTEEDYFEFMVASYANAFIQGSGLPLPLIKEAIKHGVSQQNT